MNEPSWTIWAGLAAAVLGGLGAVASAIAAWMAFSEMRAQSSPYVVVRVVHDFTRPSVLMLIIQNTGRSAAYNVAFECRPPLPSRAWGIEEPTTPGKLFTDGPFITGIPALGPGETREIDWGQYGGISSALKKSTIQCNCSFTDSRSRSYATVNILEVESFLSTCANDRDPMKGIETALKGIDARLQTLNTRPGL